MILPILARIAPTGGSWLLIASSAPATARVTESALVPAPVALLGDDACHAWVEFFASHIRNPNTRASFARAAHVDRSILTEVPLLAGVGEKGRSEHGDTFAPCPADAVIGDPVRSCRAQYSRQMLAQGV